ncbi:MAG: hypothetical protein JOY54_02105 [Acidobacteriaceae bacterium]|nr:hypothetical protein [Acidobacteriaceae bacterium]
MSLQVFLQAQMLGSEDFLSGHSFGQSEQVADLAGRCAWLTLICEVLPRALLAELKLSRMLLGSSSAEQFLLVLAEEDIPRANEFLTRAAEDIRQLSGDTLRLVWASTENLGSWPVARKRLDDALQAKIAAPLANTGDVPGTFAPFADASATNADSYFSFLGADLASATAVHWSNEHPAQIGWDSGQYSWPLREQSSVEEEGILFPRRFAMDEDGNTRSSLEELAGRAEGSVRWGILRGDVDHFDQQLRRAASIEDHIHLSALFKEFFAGELAVLCTMPDFWRRITILYRGGDDFAVIGSWDALVLLARELERLFEKFIEQHLQSLPGVEAKTISMAIEIAPETESPVSAVFKDAGTALRAAKSTEVGSLHVFGRTLEWKRLADAEELKNGLVRLARDYGFPPDFINDLTSVYREAFSARAGRRAKAVRVDRPWRTYMRLSRVIPQARGKEFASIRNSVITNLLGTRSAGFKLRPSARVGLEWARLAANA